MKNIFIALLATVVSTTAVAQRRTTDTTKVTPSRNRVYTPGSSEASEQTSNVYAWVIKTDVLKFVTGEMNLIYERKISSKFSVEGAAGLTYSFFPNDFSLSDTDIKGSSFDTKPATGSVFRGTFKYYPSSDYDAIEGWSFGIQFFTKTNNREYDVRNDEVVSEFLNGKKDSKRRTGAALIISKQLFYDSNICLESFVGLGYSNVTTEYYTSEDNNIASDFSVNKIKTEEGALNVQLGFRIGFGN